MLYKKGSVPWIKGKKFPYRSRPKMKGHTPWNKGKKNVYSKEVIEKLRSAILREPSRVKGKHWKIKDTSKMKGRLPWNWKGGWKNNLPKCIDCGKQLAGYKAKRCIKCYGKNYSREKNKSWKGGITPENKRIRHSIEFRLWRESVFARDNWVCQKCKQRGSTILHSHHIQNFAQYPEQRFAIDNGITFCRDCHKLFHKKYGRKNNTKEQLEEFLSN